MDPDAEYDYIRSTYPSPGFRDVAFWVLIGVVLGVVSQFRHVDWWVIGGVVVSAIGWEFTKARLRRNASNFAQAEPRR